MAKGVVGIGRFWGLAWKEAGHATYCRHGQGLIYPGSSHLQQCGPGCLHSSELQKWLFFLTRIILYFEVIFLIKLNYVV